MGTGDSSSAASSASTRNRSSFSSAIRSLASVLLGNHVLDHEINIALPLAFDPVALRLQSLAYCGCVPRKPLSFTVVLPRPISPLVSRIETGFVLSVIEDLNCRGHCLRSRRIVRPMRHRSSIGIDFPCRAFANGRKTSEQATTSTCSSTKAHMSVEAF
jgi:hypothetical protein